MTKRKTADQPLENDVQPPADAAPPQERQPGDEPEKKKYEPVRGWTTRTIGQVKYRKMTDDKLKIIFFKFNLAADEKLPDAILTVVRANKQHSDGAPTGLEYKDTRKHGKIWQIPNDVEGRAVADKLDYELSTLAEKLETQGRDPF